MPSRKSKKNVGSKIIDQSGDKVTTPRNAKIVLFIFGVGPLVLMCVFLFSKGFFNAP